VKEFQLLARMLISFCTSLLLAARQSLFSEKNQNFAIKKIAILLFSQSKLMHGLLCEVIKVINRNQLY
jgi:hypothetical protein